MTGVRLTTSPSGACPVVAASDGNRELRPPRPGAEAVVFAVNRLARGTVAPRLFAPTHR